MLSNKDQLAKLLATENITIRRSVKAETASFDLVNRVLTLPILKVTSGVIMDMMTGHEVAHALWTLLSEWDKAINEEKIHKQILNIVEDARIEKKIKRKYPGIVKAFINGYKDLESKAFLVLINQICRWPWLIALTSTPRWGGLVTSPLQIVNSGQ